MLLCLCPFTPSAMSGYLQITESSAYNCEKNDNLGINKRGYGEGWEGGSPMLPNMYHEKNDLKIY